MSSRAYVRAIEVGLDSLVSGTIKAKLEDFQEYLLILQGFDTDYCPLELRAVTVGVCAYIRACGRGRNERVRLPAERQGLDFPVCLPVERVQGRRLMVASDIGKLHYCGCGEVELPHILCRKFFERYFNVLGVGPEILRCKPAGPGIAGFQHVAVVERLRILRERQAEEEPGDSLHILVHELGVLFDTKQALFLQLGQHFHGSGTVGAVQLLRQLLRRVLRKRERGETHNYGGNK
jgi:hypothetical protein